MKIFLYLLCLSTILLGGCDNSDTVSDQLNDVESIIQTSPQNALALLDSIHINGETSLKLRAKYALLKSMAYDKNFIDISSDSIIAPAVSYYSKYGSADEKMKTYFYWGLTFFNGWQYDKALSAYTMAEAEMKDATDISQKGIIYLSIASLYQKNNLNSYAKKYIDKGIEQFKLANDEKRLIAARIDEALHFQKTRQWDQAESLYLSVMENIESPDIKKILLSNLALVQINKTPPNPQRALTCYERLYTEYDQGLSLNQLGPYAYALTLLGHDAAAQKVINVYQERLSEQGSQYDYWLYRIARHHGDYYTALMNLEYSEVENIQENIRISSRNISEILADYYKSENDYHLKMIHYQKEAIYIIIGLATLLISLIIWLAHKRHQHLQQTINQNQEFIHIMIEKQKVEDSSLKHIRQQFLKSLKLLFEDHGKLLLQLEKCGRQEEFHRMSLDLRYIIDKVRTDKRLHQELAKLINEATDNGLEHLLSKIHFSNRDTQLLYYIIIGLDMRIILALMNTTPNYVYKTKSLIRRRILELEDPKTQAILDLLNT